MKKLFLKLCFVIALLAVFAACAAAEIPEPPLIRPATAGISTAFVDRGEVAGISQHPGLVRLHSEELFFSYHGGRFAEFHVQIGDFVTQGQLLASLEAEDLELQIERQEAFLAYTRRIGALRHDMLQLDIDMLLLQQAQRALDGYFNENLELEIDRARLALTHERERNNFTLRQGEDYMRQLQERMQQSNLFAPYDGYITLLEDITAGQWVAAFQNVMHIGDPDSLHVEAYGFESLDFVGTMIPRVVHQSEEIWVHTRDGVFELEYVPLTVLQQRTHGRTVPPAFFRMIGDNLPALGEHVAIYFYSQWQQDVLRVPSNAVFQMADEFYVYRIENGERMPVAIEIGARTNIFAAVLYGIAEGDEVFVRP